ncbi:L-serine ammonia-lyase, iron-sulfur-dependent, subunit alpha [Natroniella sulfidigena]|uniref:L-serine ammonia-lyase, iron-sulfur-dependent, subunit alpha n=1 Tax=Natroniella sulfidigena TaxID=723921 RepID=UPI00200B3B5F|nr:L-serine ammonia-lyase, iron-sulfur-dependent, subunit alpha [Natroniella sulfidigena]MCK8817545.1 L-serine ammonia-lyase, iron-sulfur-dependent, subunit alpha [Natroniella sulfidigena]
MYDFKTINGLIELAQKEELSIPEVVILREQELSERSEAEIRELMKKNLKVMKEAAQKGLEKDDLTSISGLTGGDGRLLAEAEKDGKSLIGAVISQAVAKALAIAEVNAAMEPIVAVPTAGSCGILPAALLTVAEKYEKKEEEVIDALFVASGIGLAIAQQASVSGAEGGCQAECGSAAGMAAGAVVYLMGGDHNQLASAVAISLKTVLGLVCDPVAGLVEVPCIKRNATGASNALVAAEMALAGIESVIPVDEVIVAMKKVGDALPNELKETSLGGLAATPTARKIENELTLNN